jgi:hypothetical protein
MAVISVIALCQGTYNVRILWRKGRFQNFDLVQFYFFSLVTLLSTQLSSSNSDLVALTMFLDPLFHYNNFWYSFMMFLLPYTQACAGISYLSNLILIILIDRGKRKWLYSDAKLRCMRNIVHAIVGLLTCVILL